jgi:mRNA interferase RelE/StbE
VPYRVTLRPAAARELDRERDPTRIALYGAILALGDEPKPPGALKLVGSRGIWRVRVNIDGVPWRITYLIDEGQRRVRVLRVARRNKGTYRRLR